QVEEVGADGRGDRRPRPDPEPQRSWRPGCRGGEAAGEPAGLGDAGQPRRDDDDGPRIAAPTGILEAGCDAVNDQGEPVGNERIEPDNADRNASGDRDLVEAVRDRDARAGGDEQPGYPHRTWSTAAMAGCNK